MVASCPSSSRVARMLPAIAWRDCSEQSLGANAKWWIWKSCVQEQGLEEEPRAGPRMAQRTLPILFINLGGEMIYIIDARLKAQAVEKERSNKVLGWARCSVL